MITATGLLIRRSPVRVGPGAPVISSISSFFTFHPFLSNLRKTQKIDLICSQNADSSAIPGAEKISESKSQTVPVLVNTYCVLLPRRETQLRDAGSGGEF